MGANNSCLDEKPDFTSEIVDPSSPTPSTFLYFGDPAFHNFLNSWDDNESDDEEEFRRMMSDRWDKHDRANNLDATVLPVETNVFLVQSPSIQRHRMEDKDSGQLSWDHQNSSSHSLPPSSTSLPQAIPPTSRPSQQYCSKSHKKGQQSIDNEHTAAIFHAIKVGDEELLKALTQFSLPRGVDPSTCNIESDTNISSAKPLLKQPLQPQPQAQPQSQSQSHYHILHKIRFSNGLTPLHVAVMHNRYAVAQFLVREAGVDVRAIDAANQTPADWAKLRHNKRMLQIVSGGAWGVRAGAGAGPGPAQADDTVGAKETKKEKEKVKAALSFPATMESIGIQALSSPDNVSGLTDPYCGVDCGSDTCVQSPSPVDDDNLDDDDDDCCDDEDDEDDEVVLEIGECGEAHIISNCSQRDSWGHNYHHQHKYAHHHYRGGDFDGIGVRAGVGTEESERVVAAMGPDAATTMKGSAMSIINVDWRFRGKREGRDQVHDDDVTVAGLGGGGGELSPLDERARESPYIGVGGNWDGNGKKFALGIEQRTPTPKKKKRLSKKISRALNKAFSAMIWSSTSSSSSSSSSSSVSSLSSPSISSTSSTASSFAAPVPSSTATTTTTLFQVTAESVHDKRQSLR